MTLRNLLDKKMEPEKILLDYDGCEIEFEKIEYLEDEAFQADFVDEEVISYKYGLRNGFKTLVINM